MAEYQIIFDLSCLPGKRCVWCESFSGQGRILRNGEPLGHVCPDCARAVHRGGMRELDAHLRQMAEHRRQQAILLEATADTIDHDATIEMQLTIYDPASARGGTAITLGCDPAANRRTIK